ncbi:gas vesicle protein GvpJ [Saccharomonospora sp. NPDC046836]|uniref:gas vesicle protein GvpJ n=1 Tax=Saccharomonospora sp. NPDC046836 TaxID=3156921 RepID=UPI0033C6D517
MTTAMQPTGNGGGIDRPSSSSLADVIDTILDKGLVIDAYVRVSLVGIELVTIDARIVVASVDTYLRFADAVNRLDLAETGGQKGLPELIEDINEGGARSRTKGVLEAAGETLKDVLSDEKRQPAARRDRKERD